MHARRAALFVLELLMHVFDEVTALALQNGASLKLEVTRDEQTTLKFKPYGQRIVTIHYDYPKGAMRELLRQFAPARLGVVIAEGGRVFDNEMMLHKATPVQLANMRALLTKLMELRQEILRPMPVEYYEPVLASPRDLPPLIRHG